MARRPRWLSRWHTIVMGTPTLWDTVELNSVLWTAPDANPDRMMSLLHAFLQRGGKTLLKLAVLMANDPPYGPALELLADHSERWQTANFITSWPNGLRHLSAAKGRLFHLKMLSLSGSPAPIDIFGVAPCLKEVAFLGVPGTVLECTKLPLQQLRSFQCGEFWGVGEMIGLGTSPTMSLMPRLTDAYFTLHLSRFDPSETVITSAPVPPITCTISGFLINVADSFSPANIGPTLAAIVDSLTLPALSELAMDSEEYPRLPLPWPHPQFLGLARRSSFDAHLLSLELYHSLITEVELLECLNALPALDRLGVSDHQLGAGTTRHLITSTLFAALTSPGPTSPPPAPRLSAFQCRSLLQFDDTVFLSFLLSRVAGKTDDDGLFEIDISWLPGHQRDLDLHLLAQIDELQAAEALSFVFDAVER
ncbi:hypothetical protein B0H17DRAFT_397401 [Mycena rosella]|uniref:Uncharacterized protein n=1 Tax=Mycena rosella TaxID=1033263 RepID=A0AAD7CM74_MYCRO|nr:hypothetical protein B0H17DRAFT_397401 [Mycena rosella]